MPQVLKYSRFKNPATLDGRSAAARIYRRTKRDLTAQVGGKPSATQALLIERAAILSLHMSYIDARTLQAGQISDHDSRTYLAWSNTLTRTVRELGGSTVKTSDPLDRLQRHLASKAA